MRPCVNKVKVSTLRMLLVGCIPLICFGCILNGRSAAADEPSVLKVVNWNVLYGFNHKKSIEQGVDWMSFLIAKIIVLKTNLL